MRFLTIAALTSAVLAAPWEVISKRALARRDNQNQQCPTSLPQGEYVSPTITWVDQRAPNWNRFDADFGLFTPNAVASIFNFEIPEFRAGANCTLEFLFPHQPEPGFFQGSGKFYFKGYNPGSCPGPQTTWNNQPEKGPFPDFPPIVMEPGHAYTIDVGPCFVGAGKCVAGMTWTEDTWFAFEQTDQNCPFGMFTTYEYGLPCPKEYCP